MKNILHRSLIIFLLALTTSFLFPNCSRKSKLRIEIPTYKEYVEINEEKSSLNGFILHIPRGELLKTAKLTIEEVSPPAFNEDQIKQIGPAIELKLDNAHTTFKQNCKITIPLVEEITDIPIIGYFNDETNKWEFIKAETLESNAKGLSFETNHFSVFMPMMVKIGGIKNILKSAASSFDLINPSLNEQFYTSGQAEDLINKLNVVADDSYKNLTKLSNDYEQCRTRTSCDLVYGKLINQISEMVISQSTEKILADVVLKEIGGALVVKTAFLIGDVITSIVLVDCISCYLPNSVISREFWLNFLKYNIAKSIIEQVNNRTISEGYFLDIRDGESYRTIKIGDQTWLAENLRLNGEKGTYNYNMQKEIGDSYGKLYTWAAANAYCPIGWHLPSKDEYQKLINFFGERTYNELLLGGVSGFNAQLGGYCAYGEQEISIFCFHNGLKGYYWTSSESSQGWAWSLDFYDDDKRFQFSTNEKEHNQFSVRYLQNDTIYESNIRQRYYTSSFTDSRDNKVYKTIEINNLVWFEKNLNFNSGSTSTCYGNDISNCELYGRIYSWPAANNVCPEGWRLPTNKEFESLSISTNNPFLDAQKDSIIFNSAGGFRLGNSFQGRGGGTTLWGLNEQNPCFITLDNVHHKISTGYGGIERWGCYVKCIKNK